LHMLRLGKNPPLHRVVP